jgi:hypothetical protein
MPVVSAVVSDWWCCRAGAVVAVLDRRGGRDGAEVGWEPIVVYMILWGARLRQATRLDTAGGHRTLGAEPPANKGIR